MRCANFRPGSALVSNSAIDAWPLSFAAFLAVAGMSGATSAYAADANIRSDNNGSVASPADKVKTDAPVDPDSLRIKGLNIGLPGFKDTIDPDVGGARSELAKAGIGYIGMSLNNFYENTLPHAFAPTHAQQLYNGQNFTASSQNFMFITYDLSRFGIQDGQIVVAAGDSQYTWNGGGPSRFGLTMATYYQTFLDRTFELKLGYVHNGWEFAGTNVGGSLASSVFGPAGSIIYQGGINNANVPTPGVIFKYNIDDHFYDKVTAQRSVSPDGQVAEVNANPAAVDWTVPNAGVLYLNEFGYKRDAAPNVAQMWVRAGAAYNTSNYNNKEFPGTRTEGNSFYYLLADRQLWQSVPVKGSAGRGVYAGFSVMYAPPELNTISQYYEARLYGKGLFNSRPDDLISLVLTDTVFSNYSVYQALLKNQLAHTDSKAITVSYNAHLAPGIYGSVGLSYIDHPTSVTYTTQTGSALNALAALNIFW
ncbi:porin [Bradyrhizobium sacchari]|uniref:Porin n=2 Tax=Bradyrhizobium sacchari TaxID=1399419 RepID=A0A560J0P7_9BRAD|nr:porin [Bradyrhizobium sacchari]TWB80875.1 porin [Bradyrhizobium sacchari]